MLIFTAPLVYLDVNEPYFPSDIGSQIPNTQPEFNFTPVAAPKNLDLNDLSSLNALGNCTVQDPDGCLIYLTSKVNVTTDPDWFHGVVPDSSGETNGATSCAVIVVDHGSGLVDAYYFYFYAFNLGLEIFGHVGGNHVGDWEHTMVRFQDGKPQTLWYSVHTVSSMLF